MPFARIRPDCQISMPEDVLRQIPLTVGDLLEIETHDGRIVLTPVDSARMSGLAVEDQARLETVRSKMAEIRRDLASAPGLSEQEADIAVRAGLIADAERWWWMEDWLAGEREAEREIRQGRVRHFADPEAFFEDLGS